MNMVGHKTALHYFALFLSRRFLENLLIAFHFKRFTSKEVFSYIPGNVEFYESPRQSRGFTQD